MSIQFSAENKNASRIRENFTQKANKREAYGWSIIEDKWKRSI